MKGGVLKINLALVCGAEGGERGGGQLEESGCRVGCCGSRQQQRGWVEQKGRVLVRDQQG